MRRCFNLRQRHNQSVRIFFTFVLGVCVGSSTLYLLQKSYHPSDQFSDSAWQDIVVAEQSPQNFQDALLENQKLRKKVDILARRVWDLNHTQHNTLESQVSGLREKLKAQEELQRNLFLSLSQFAKQDVKSLENAIHSTGLSLPHLLKHMEEDGMGGPFEEISHETKAVLQDTMNSAKGKKPETKQSEISGKKSPSLPLSIDKGASVVKPSKKTKKKKKDAKFLKGKIKNVQKTDDAADSDHSSQVAPIARTMIASMEKPSDMTAEEFLYWNKLQTVIMALPLAKPVEKARLSSHFGPRKDPFRKRLAMHHGLDFAAPTKTPVYATAPGTVVFAGRRAGYGTIIEVDHGFGLRTRYAHLSKSLVKSGDTIDFGQNIGQVGSTGRSTGPHLHYEVRHNGVPLDPEKFINAGDSIFKRQD